MGTKKGQKRKTARRAYEPKKKKKLSKKDRMRVHAKLKKEWEAIDFSKIFIDIEKMLKKGK